MNTNNRFRYLLDLYIEGSISYAEIDEFFELVSSGDYDHVIQNYFDKTIFEEDYKYDANLPNDISDDLIRNILNKNKWDLATAKKRGIFSLGRKLIIAASVLIAAVGSFYFTVVKNNENRFVSTFVSSSTQKSINKTSVPMAVILPDGSKVVLQPKSSLFYSVSKFTDKREVYMEGEAYFKIAKNPLKPFYVYYNKLVTKVLGTSFNIKTNAQTGNVEVAVLTGKVQVYENDKIITNKQKNMGLIVTPNQKVIFETSKLFFETTIVDKPLPITVIDDEKSSKETVVKPVEFNFENAKLSTVFKKLENSYGIEIVVSNEDIYNCVFSGNVTTQDLFDKLKIITLATNSTYEVNATKILIKGNGCKKN